MVIPLSAVVFTDFANLIKYSAQVDTQQFFMQGTQIFSKKISINILSQSQERLICDRSL